MVLNILIPVERVIRILIILKNKNLLYIQKVKGLTATPAYDTTFERIYHIVENTYKIQ